MDSANKFLKYREVYIPSSWVGEKEDFDSKQQCPACLEITVLNNDDSYKCLSCGHRWHYTDIKGSN